MNLSFACLLLLALGRQEFSKDAELPKDGNPLVAYQRLAAHEREYMASPNRGLYLQTKATFLSFMGDDDQAAVLFDEFQGPSAQHPQKFDARYAPCNAAQAIADVAKTRRAIMIGEAHEIPQTRLLTTELLKPLWNEGFRYFALEDIRTNKHRLDRNSFPTSANGYYVNEPVYADMVRQALRIGYRVVMYDDETDDPKIADLGARVNRREELEAEHLKTRIFDRDPYAKVLVHVGFGHNIKTPDSMGSAPVRLMANRFKQLTHIDPFCVDGYTLREHPHRELESTFYQAFADKIHDVSLLRDAQGKFFTESPGLDAFAILPRPKRIRGRQDWLTVGLHRHPVDVPVANLLGSGPWLVEARYLQAPDEAIPVDRVFLRSISVLIPLILPKGTFRVHIYSEKTGWYSRQTAHVP